MIPLPFMIWNMNIKTVVKMAEIYKKYVGNEILDVARNYQKRIFLTLAKRTGF